MDTKELSDALIQRFGSQETLNMVFNYQEAVKKWNKKESEKNDLEDDIHDIESELMKKQEQLKEINKDLDGIIEDVENARSEAFDCVSNGIAKIVNDEGV